MWGMLCHLSALSALVGVPFGHILGPLLVWQIKKNEMPFADDQGCEALNFQLPMSIYIMVAAVFSLLLSGLPALLILPMVDVILTIVGGVRANSGERYRYPATTRFFN